MIVWEADLITSFILDKDLELLVLKSDAEGDLHIGGDLEGSDVPPRTLEGPTLQPHVVGVARHHKSSCTACRAAEHRVTRTKRQKESWQQRAAHVMQIRLRLPVTAKGFSWCGINKHQSTVW